MSSHLATRDHAIRVKERVIYDTRVALFYANCVVWNFVPFVLNSNSIQLDNGNTTDGRNGCRDKHATWVVVLSSYLVVSISLFRLIDILP